MTEGETTRLAAWSNELRTVHGRLREAHPELRDTLRYLQQDHSMIAHLLGALQAAVERGASPLELERHLDGIGAIMESHLRYEERQLLGVLETLSLDSDPGDVLGPL